MAATTQNQVMEIREPGGLMHGPGASGVNLYEGTVCFWDVSDGSITDTDGTVAGTNPVAGVNRYERLDADAREAEFYTSGVVEHIPHDGSLTSAQLGSPVHAIDNFTLAASGGSVIGTLEKVYSATKCAVRLRTTK